LYNESRICYVTHCKTNPHKIKRMELCASDKTGQAATIPNKLRSETIGSHIRLVIEIPILGYFGVWGYFWSIYLLAVHNLTSNSFSATPISIKATKFGYLA